MTSTSEASPRAAADAAPFRVELVDNAVALSGDLHMADAPQIWRELRKASASAKGELNLDVSRASSVDGSVVALLVELRNELTASGVASEFVGADDRLQPLLEVYAGHEPAPKAKKKRPEGTIAQIGRVTIYLLDAGKNILAFLGDMVWSLAALIRRPREGHWKDVPRLAEKTGPDAVPIVLLINFLVGFVIAFQAARQLKLYGANIFVADLVGISITRELAPLMTAIIVCGRSGAAFAAELGTMKVDEEIDALRTMGLTPLGWLVLPRVLALVLVMPILVLLADVVGIAGGLAVARWELDLTSVGYLLEIRKAVRPGDVASGLLKSVVFAVTIGLIACQQGFAATGGAEGVGKRTTAAVVTSLFALVLLDTAFTIIFRFFHF